MYISCSFLNLIPFSFNIHRWLLLQLSNVMMVAKWQIYKSIFPSIFISWIFNSKGRVFPLSLFIYISMDSWAYILFMDFDTWLSLFILTVRPWQIWPTGAPPAWLSCPLGMSPGLSSPWPSNSPGSPDSFQGKMLCVETKIWMLLFPCMYVYANVCVCVYIVPLLAMGAPRVDLCVLTQLQLSVMESLLSDRLVSCVLSQTWDRPFLLQVLVPFLGKNV